MDSSKCNECIKFYNLDVNKKNCYNNINNCYVYASKTYCYKCQTN